MMTFEEFMSSPLSGIPILCFLGLLYFLRPRKAHQSDAPPMVLSSPVVKIPLIGQAIEFGMSPVKMTKRCYDQYGPVFTVPVSHYLFQRPSLEQNTREHYGMFLTYVLKPCV